MPTPERIVSVLRLARSKRFRAAPPRRSASCDRTVRRGRRSVRPGPPGDWGSSPAARAGPRSAVGSARSRSPPAPACRAWRPWLSSLLVVLRFGLVVGLVGRLLLVALAAQRRRHACAEHHQVDRTPHAHVLGRLREPLVDRAGVGRGEEVEVLAAGVEDRIGRVAQPVGDRPRLARLQVVGVDRVIPGSIDQGVGDPARVGRPGGARHDGLVRPKDRRRGDLLHLPAGQVDPEQRRRVVDVGDLAAVGRPDGVLVGAGPAGIVDLRLALAVGRADVQPVLAAFVREPGDRPAVGRPGGRAVVHAGRLGQIVRVALLGRHGDDLAAVLEHGPGAGRRNVGVADVLGRAFDVSRPGLGQVAGHADLQPRARSRRPDRTDSR